jgi:hypothetical protein
MCLREFALYCPRHSNLKAQYECTYPRGIAIGTTTSATSVCLWLQVRDVDAVGGELEEAGVDIVEPPTEKP